MGAVNSKGLPERSYKSKSHLEKNSSTPIRFGEFEGLNISIGLETSDYAVFQALYRTSIKGRQDLAKIAMDPGRDYGDISDTYDSRTAEIFNVILLSLSLGLEFVSEENEITYYDKENMNSHVINGKGYLCSDFTAMMLERVFDTESGILNNTPIMDLNELKEQVRDLLLTTPHLIGTKDPDEVDKIIDLYY